MSGWVAQILFISFVLFTGRANAAIPTFPEKTGIPFGCDAKIGELTTVLEVKLASRDPAVVVYEAEKEFHDFIFRTRISSEPGQTLDAVDLVVSYPSVAGKNRDTLISFSAGMYPTAGVDSEGHVHAWKEAVVRLTLPSGKELSLACYSKPMLVATIDEASTGNWGF